MQKKSLLLSKVKCWGLVGIVLAALAVGVLIITPKAMDASPMETKETNATETPISLRKKTQPQVNVYSSDEIQHFVERQISLKSVEPLNSPRPKEDLSTTIETALNACQPFAGEEVLNVTRFERARLVTHCAVAKADDTLEISITCRDKATVEWFKQHFDTLIALDYEPLVLRGRVNCLAFLPFLQNPPKGVVSYAFYSQAKLRNIVATSPRFMGTSSSSDLGSQGLGYYGLDGSGEIVAVIDTGISSGDYGNNFHCDLRGGLYGMVPEPTSSYKTAIDKDGHGTHVCGSIISRGRVTDTQSGAQGALLFAQSIGSEGVNQSGNTITIIQSFTDYGRHFERSALIGASILSNSWGDDFSMWEYGSYGSIASSIDAFVWRNPEVLVLFAGGNAGRDSDGDGIPDEETMVSKESYSKNALIVGAQESYREEYSYIYGTYYSSNERISKDLFAQPYDGKTDGMAVFSSRGPLTDGRISPMIVAPGTGICSTGASSQNEHKTENGTSMATPQVAASAAVLRQYLKEYHKIQRPTAAVMRAGLILCADSLYPGQYGSASPEIPQASPNNAEGWGALRLGKHLAGIARDGTKGTPQTLGFVDRISLKNTSETFSFSFTTTAMDDIRVVLSWIDYYSVADETQPLCNDYDLEITIPNGEVYTLNDHLNPIERIIIEDAPSGTYRVKVRCSRMSNAGEGNIAAVAWSATTSTDVKTFDVPTASNTTYTLTVKLPEDVTAYADYPVWPAPGKHTFGSDESFSPIAGPKLSYTSGEHGVTHLAGWILFDAEGNPIQQHFPKHEDVICYSMKKAFSGVTQALEKPITLSSDQCTLQWYTSFPGYGIRLK